MRNAQTVPASVARAAPIRMPRDDTPARDNDSATSDPPRMPLKMKTFARAMTAPRRSAGARHCRRASSGTIRRPLAIPSSIMRTRVP